MSRSIRTPVPRPLPTTRSDLIASDVVRWLWRGRIPLAMVTLIEGAGGIGKSLLLAWLAAAVSRGDLEGDLDAPAHTIILATEDDQATIWVPRLDAASAERVHISLLNDGVVLRLPADADLLEATISKIGAKLVIIDPVASIMHATTPLGIRSAIEPLVMVSRRTGAAIILVRHLNGREGASARQRGLGGSTLANVARVSYLLATHPDDGDSAGGQRILAPIQFNVGPAPRALVGCIEAVDAGPRLQWITESDMTADECLARRDKPQRPRGRPRLDEAMSLLRRVLADGPRLEREIAAEAASLGIATSTLRDARGALGVESRRQEFGGPYWLSLPPARAIEIDADGDVAAQARERELPPELRSEPPDSLERAPSWPPVASSGATARRRGRGATRPPVVAPAREAGVVGVTATPPLAGASAAAPPSDTASPANTVAPAALAASAPSVTPSTPVIDDDPTTKRFSLLELDGPAQPIRRQLRRR